MKLPKLTHHQYLGYGIHVGVNVHGDIVVHTIRTNEKDMDQLHWLAFTGEEIEQLVEYKKAIDIIHGKVEL